jgi:hypothetical protein
MASNSARRGFLQLQRNFSSTALRPAWTATAPKAAATTSTTTAKPITPSATPAKPTTTTATTPAKPVASASTTVQRTVAPSFAAKEAPVPTWRNNNADTAAAEARSKRSLTDGLSDAPPEVEGVPAIDWTRSYHGLGSISFSPEQAEVLLNPIVHDDVEVKPDGLLYLPEIKYRRILNKAFGPGGWGLAPRGESIVTAKIVTREYGLIVQGR